MVAATSALPVSTSWAVRCSRSRSDWRVRGLELLETGLGGGELFFVVADLGFERAHFALHHQGPASAGRPPVTARPW